jgi:hypothetical protein
LQAKGEGHATARCVRPEQRARTAPSAFRIIADSQVTAPSTEALGKGLRVIRLGEAEDHKLYAIAAHMKLPRCHRQGVGKAAHGFAVLEDLVGRQRDVVRA